MTIVSSSTTDRVRFTNQSERRYIYDVKETSVALCRQCRSHIQPGENKIEQKVGDIGQHKENNENFDPDGITTETPGPIDVAVEGRQAGSGAS